MHILNLDTDCFGHIFKYLQIQDHINVSQVCLGLRQAVQLWASALYPTFYIDEIVTDEFNPNTLRQQLILCGILSETIRKLVVNINHADYHFYSSKEACLLDNQLSIEAMNHHFLTIYRQKGHEPKELIPVEGFCNLIRQMQFLESLTISKNSFFYVPNPKIINEVILALKDLPNLRNLTIRTKLEIDIENLCEIKNIDSLHLEGLKKTDDLVKYCKSNKNLRALWLHNCKIDGNLSDIVPHCQKLEEISFRLDKDSNAYAQMADLGNLKSLNIKSVYDVNVSNLLKAFSQKPLDSLKFIETVVDFECTQQIIKIETLREVQLLFDDRNAVELLAQLSELRVVCLTFRGNATDFCIPCLKILNSNRNLKCVQITTDLGEEFRKEAFRLIKTIRNVKGKGPLQLEMPEVEKLSHDELKLLDQNYVTFNRLPFFRSRLK